MYGLHTELPDPGVTAFIDLAAQAKLARSESAGASDPFSSNLGYPTVMLGLGVVETLVCLTLLLASFE